MKLPFHIDLAGKTALVIGAGGVICSELSSAFAACGVNIALLDLKLEAATAVADQIVAAGGKTKGYAFNVLERASLDAIHATVLKDFGSCDILINGAGGNHPKAATTKENSFVGDEELADLTAFFNLDAEGVGFVFNLNFLGTLIPSQVFAANAYTPLTKIPAYFGVKVAVSNFTRWLAVHFARECTRVNAISPGFFSTAQNAKLLIHDDGTPKARTGKILAATPWAALARRVILLVRCCFLSVSRRRAFSPVRCCPSTAVFRRIPVCKQEFFCG